MMAFGWLLYLIGIAAGAVQRFKRLFHPVCVDPGCEQGKPHQH